MAKLGQFAQPDFGQLTQPAAPGSPAIEPAPMDPQGQAQNTSAWRGILQGIAADPDALRNIGVMGAWIASGQPVGNAILAGFNAQANTLAARQKAREAFERGEREQAQIDERGRSNRAQEGLSRQSQVETRRSNREQERLSGERNLIAAERNNIARRSAELRGRVRAAGGEGMAKYLDQAASLIPDPLDPKDVDKTLMRRLQFAGALQQAEAGNPTQMMAFMAQLLGQGAEAGAEEPAEPRARVSDTTRRPVTRGAVSGTLEPEGVEAPEARAPEPAEPAGPRTRGENIQELRKQGLRQVSPLRRAHQMAQMSGAGAPNLDRESVRRALEQAQALVDSPEIWRSLAPSTQETINDDIRWARQFLGL